VEQLRVALVGSSDLVHLNRFEVDLLEGIDLLLVGTGCLVLAIGMFANVIILAMAIAFLEQLYSFQHQDPFFRASSEEIFFPGASMAVVTLALLAFKTGGGERAERRSEALERK
jgi:hypothetical protein